MCRARSAEIAETREFVIFDSDGNGARATQRSVFVGTESAPELSLVMQIGGKN